MARMAILASGALILGAVTGITAATVSRPDEPVAAGVKADREMIISGHGSNYRPDRTAERWVTYADHVIAATALSETERVPDDAQLKNGEGLVGRDVALKVDDVIWSEKEPKHAAPTQLDVAAWGSKWNDGNFANRVPVAEADSPRLEPGHSYILAITWEAARCSAGDRDEPGQWQALGVDSIIPFDGGIIGNGELAGRLQNAQEARAALSSENPFPSLEDEMLGRSANDLRTALEAATPGKVEQFESGSPCRDSAK